MRLLDYLQRHRVSCRELGEKVGVSTTMIWKIANGKKGASLATAVKIQEATRGLVQPADLILEEDAA